MASEDLKAVMAPPKHEGGVLSPDLDWPAMMIEAQGRFPDAAPRIMSLPTKSGGLISLRMQRAAEWLPNGRTQVWFDPADGRIVGTLGVIGPTRLNYSRIVPMVDYTAQLMARLSRGAR